jgi:hypothetical protein
MAVQTSKVPSWLAEEAQQLRGVRVAAVNEMLGSFKASRDEMDTQLRKDLAQGEAARLQSWLIGVFRSI